VAAKRRSPWRRLSWPVGIAVGVWLIGFISSMAFNQTLDRPARFANESALDWWVWGLKALVPTIVYMSLVAVLWLGATSLWRLAARLIPQLGTWSAAVAHRWRAWWSHVGFDDPDVAAHALLAAHVAALLLFVWAFRNLLGAFVSIVSEVPQSALAPLAPERIDMHGMYGLTLAVLLLVLGAGWYRVRLLRRADGSGPGRPTLMAGAVAMGLTIVLLSFPYRIMWHNQFDRALWAGRCCFAVGESGNEVLLYCPDETTPRTRAVAAADPSVHRLRISESIYTAGQQACRASKEEP
jgi:hypothetical protein